MKRLLFNKFTVLLVLISITSGAETAKQTLSLANGRFEYSEITQASIALDNLDGSGLAAVKCEKEDQEIVYGGCDTYGAVVLKTDSTTRYGAGQGVVRGAYGIYASNGHYTWICKFKDLKQGDHMVAKVVCK